MPAIHDLSFAPSGRRHDPGALLTNRQGHLTRDQRRAVKRYRRGRMSQAVARTALLGGSVTLDQPRRPSATARRAPGDPRLLGLVLLKTAGRPTCYGMSWRATSQRAGCARWKARSSRQAGERITFRVWDQRARLTLAAPPDEPLHRGMTYRIYMLPRSGLLLGVEARYERARAAARVRLPA